MGAVQQRMECAETDKKYCPDFKNCGSTMGEAGGGDHRTKQALNRPRKRKEDARWRAYSHGEPAHAGDFCRSI